MIDTKTFFIFGYVCFLVIAVCQTANLMIFFYSFNFFSIVISLAQIVFSFVTAGFFSFMYKTQSVPVTQAETSDYSAIDEALKELKNDRRSRARK